MYDQYITINKKFKSSVNLQYDLGNVDKLLQYVPTTDLCDVIKSYAKSILFGDTYRSTLLAGPYGKGKSYIMLVITYLLSKRENREVFEALLRKISAIDVELADYIKVIDKENISLLPVIINNNDSDDINQNFMLALRNALKNEGLENIIPDSVFSECLKQIDIWANSVDLNLLALCEEKYKINIISLKNGLKDFRVIVRINDRKISDDVFYNLRRIYAAQDLLEGKSVLSETAKEALKISIDDIASELNDYLKDYHVSSICLNKTDFSIHSLRDVAYNALVRSFPNTIVFNNEQVNKNVLSSVTTKARNNVIDNILGITDIVYGPNSAEGTILASFDESVQRYGALITDLQKMIIDSKKKLCVAKVVNYLSDTPFGMRKGVIPLFIAKTVSMLNIFDRNAVQTVLLYNNTMQIKMDATNLTKVMNSPLHYYFSFKKVNKDRIHFIEAIAKTFEVRITRNFNEDAESVVKGIRSYVSNLEPVIVKSSLRDNLLSLSENEIKFKDLFLRHDLSTFDILCDELNCFGGSSAEILGNIVFIKNEYKEKVARLYHDSILKLKQTLSGLQDESIRTNYTKWKNDNPHVENIIFDDGNKKIFNAFESSQYNDYEVIDKLSFAVLNCTLNDWNCRKQEQFFRAIQEFIGVVHNTQAGDVITKNDIDISLEVESLSRLGMTLYTNLQAVLDEYGSSISNSEKANIVRKLLKDIIK